ncbi:DMT family transporter [Melghirimyces algeriensis]|uniref:Permease of the drug/metabolite transporter (DMT) superfamily n=1 Tax=Melghirimyces algeriensis TaxID=910412 RepID=A0A521B0Y8_9BACL|nr:DMT family transporter [Melghirimyces algeriensis]SMO40774.1 Permease of the drug/metabolite transporter (DMT) superfamily [Melghirimyces algeriensis]
MKTKRWTYLSLIMMAFFWGSAFAGSKLAVNAVPPEVAAFFRFGLGALFMLLVLWLGKGEERKLPRSHWRQVILLGLIGVAAYNLLLFSALYFSQASDGSMIIPTTSPLITTVLAVLFLKEKLMKKQVLGLVLACFGSLVFFSQMVVGQFSGERLFGDFLFLLAALCWSTYTLVGNRVLKQLDPFPVTAYAMLTGALVLGIISLPKMGEISWSSLSVGFWTLQIYLALFPSVLANWFYYRGVQSIGASGSAIFMYIVPVSGILLAILLLKESFTVVQIVGSFLMVLGVWFVSQKQKTPVLRSEDISLQQKSS